jgi:CopG family nickel-responsive transcriptional regulator
MPELSRIGIALHSDLLAKFDQLIAKRKYTNRSEAFRDLIRAELIARDLASPSSSVVATITVVYDHHTRLLKEKLTDMQHRYQDLIVSNLHIHLDADHCLEVIVARGRGSDVKALADTLISVKGVKHGGVVQTSAKGGLP